MCTDTRAGKVAAVNFETVDMSTRLVMNLHQIRDYLPRRLHHRKSGTHLYSGFFWSSDNQLTQAEERSVCATLNSIHDCDHVERVFSSLAGQPRRSIDKNKRIHLSQNWCGDAADRTAPSLLTLDAKPSVKQDANSSSPRRVKSLFEDSSDDEDVDFKGWKSKPIEEWNQMDTRNWLFCSSQKIGQLYREISPDLAVLPGKKLLLLSRHDFLVHDHRFGSELYDLLRGILHLENSLPFSHYQRDSRKVLDFKLDLQSDGGSAHEQESSSTDEESVEIDSQKKRRRPGRPRNVESKVREVGPKVWEYIRDLLLDPQYCPDWIRWENYGDKTFRFVESQKVAKRWGARKQNGKMNFEKFSRAMRYYYDKDILESVPRRRLVYKFGPSATGLDQIESPNFEAGYLKKS